MKKACRPCLQLRRDESVQPFARDRVHDPGNDLMATRRFLGYQRDVQIGIQGKSHGARIGGRAHEQQVRIHSLAAQRRSLVDAESLLFINDCDRQIVEAQRPPG